MQRRESHTIHFQEFENLERDCYALLRRGKSEECIAVLEKHLDIHPNEELKRSLVILSSRHYNNKSAYSRGIITDQDCIQESNKINFHILELVPQLKPPDFQEYQNSSLRRKSKWDERENLTVCLQFDRDFNHLDNLFQSLEIAWRLLIQTGSYTINENGEEILLGIDLEKEELPTGVGRGQKIVLQEDFETQDGSEHEREVQMIQTEQEEQSVPQETIQADSKISLRDLKDNNALRIKKVYAKRIPVIDEFGNEDVETIEESSLAFIEKVERRFQIWISVVGSPETKCTLINELLEWFEKHEIFKNYTSERFTVCIPQALGFRALESSSTEVSISMKQPV